MAALGLVAGYGSTDESSSSSEDLATTTTTTTTTTTSTSSDAATTTSTTATSDATPTTTTTTTATAGAAAAKVELSKLKTDVDNELDALFADSSGPDFLAKPKEAVEVRSFGEVPDDDPEPPSNFNDGQKSGEKRSASPDEAVVEQFYEKRKKFMKGIRKEYQEEKRRYGHQAGPGSNWQYTSW